MVYYTSTWLTEVLDLICQGKIIWQFSRNLELKSCICRLDIFVRPHTADSKIHLVIFENNHDDDFQTFFDTQDRNLNCWSLSKLGPPVYRDQWVDHFLEGGAGSLTVPWIFTNSLTLAFLQTRIEDHPKLGPRGLSWTKRKAGKRNKVTVSHQIIIMMILIKYFSATTTPGLLSTPTPENQLLLIPNCNEDQTEHGIFHLSCQVWQLDLN